MMNLDGIPDYMKEYPQFFKDLLGFSLFFGGTGSKKNSQDAPPVLHIFALS